MCAAMDGKAANMPEELLHEREYTRTGIAPAGSSIALADMAAEDAADEDAAAAKKGSDAELGKAAKQNGHGTETMVGHLLVSEIICTWCSGLSCKAEHASSRSHKSHRWPVHVLL